MEKKDEVLNFLRQNKQYFRDNYRVTKLGLFGSFARGDEKAESDVDILVNFKKPISLFDHAGIEIDLENKTGRKVDLVTERSLSNPRHAHSSLF